jgi:hypothetical protein
VPQDDGALASSCAPNAIGVSIAWWVREGVHQWLTWLVQRARTEWTRRADTRSAGCDDDK